MLIVQLEANAAMLRRMRIEKLIAIDGCHQQWLAAVQRLSEAQQTGVCPEELDAWLTWRGRKLNESQSSLDEAQLTEQRQLWRPLDKEELARLQWRHLLRIRFPLPDDIQWLLIEYLQNM